MFAADTYSMHDIVVKDSPSEVVAVAADIRYDLPEVVVVAADTYARYG